MAKRKYFYYVAVLLDGNSCNFVYEVNRNTKVALWNPNEKPLAMPKAVAEDLAEGLILNFIPAVVVQSFVELQSTAPKKDAEDKENR